MNRENGTKEETVKRMKTLPTISEDDDFDESPSAKTHAFLQKPKSSQRFNKEDVGFLTKATY